MICQSILQTSQFRRSHFAESINAGEKPMLDGIDGLAVTRLILKMQESAEKGLPVEVGDLYR
ncbi:MAG: hypothetical protein ABI210_06805 [Abditibacteriaceae bacterium]